MFDTERAALGTNIAAVGILATAPQAGEYAIIVLFGLLGGLVKVSRVRDIQKTPWQAGFILFRSVAMAATFSWLVTAYVIDRWGQTSIAISSVLSGSAFLISFIGDDWFRVKDAALGWIAARLGAKP